MGVGAVIAMPPTVVLTRPAGQSIELAHALAAHHIDLFEFPLIRLSAVDDDTPLLTTLTSLPQYALVIFVSPNAINHTLAHMSTRWPTTVPIGVIGPGSVHALKRYGIAAPAYHVIAPPTAFASLDQLPRYDSEALASALDNSLGLASLAARQVLIVRGDRGRGWLANCLRAHGALIQTLIAYRCRIPDPTATQWTRVRDLLTGQRHLWLLTSSESVRNLEAMAQVHLDRQQTLSLKQTPMVALHARIAESAHKLGFNRVTLVDTSRQSIIHTLTSLLKF